tara:strand:- start:24 stop:251 length:228 start_codon:yes stop_codon:yes gene_type:complete
MLMYIYILFWYFLTISRKRSLDEPFYLLERQHLHTFLGFREVRGVHPRVVLVGEGVYLLVAFLDALLSGLFAVVV